MMAATLNIISHNIRAWTQNNKNELSNYYLTNNPDIVAMQSHGIRDQTKYIKLFGFSGHTSGNEAHSGVATLTKYNIKHTFHSNTWDINTLATTIETTRGPICVINFYRPPRQDYLPLMELQRHLDRDIPTLILTDANVGHRFFGHNNNTPLGTIFKKFCRDKELHFTGPNFKTFYSGRLKGKPDLVLANNAMLTFAINITEGKRMVASDHVPIHITVGTGPLAVPINPVYNFNRANWEGFKENLETIQLPNVHGMNPDQLDTEWTNLLNNIKIAADTHIPKTRFKIIHALNKSTRTKNLENIYNTRHNIYKHNMTQERADILHRIYTTKLKLE